VGIPKKKKPIFRETKKKPSKGYYVITKMRKKPVLITPRPLEKGQALAFGVQYTKKSERATFKLVPTTRAPTRIAIKPMKETEVWGAGYRPPVRKGKYLPMQLTYIQKKPTRMGTRKEIVSIQAYKRGGKNIW